MVVLLYTTPNSTRVPPPNPSQALRYVFQRSFCGSWRRMEGPRDGHGQLEALNPLVHKHLPCTEGPAEYFTGELAAWGNDHRQLQVSKSHSVVPGATAASKTCLAAVWETSAGSEPADTPRECQPKPKQCPFQVRLSPSNLMTWQTVFGKSPGTSRPASLQWAELWQPRFSACWDVKARVVAVGSPWSAVGAQQRRNLLR